MRIKLDFPGTEIFSTEVTIGISDINYGGHMGNDRFLTVMQEARLRWLGVHGYPNERDIAPPVGLIIVDSAVQYKAEVFHGEILRVSIASENISSRGFDLFYKLSKEGGEIAAIAKTGILCFDYEIKKISNIPDQLQNALAVAK